MTTNGLAPRSLAVDLLQGVLRRGKALDQLLAGSRDFSQLAARDRAFCRNLVATALRRLGQIDAIIDTCLERPLNPRSAPTLDILRLGVAQLLFTNVPAHAAVDTAVDLVRAARAGHLTKLVNAVLRRVQREGRAMLDGQDAARLNTPAWLWRSWEDAFGPDLCRQIALAHLAPAPLDVTLKRGLDREAWAATLGARPVGAASLRLFDPGPVADLPGYAAGAWWVQDAAATLPVDLLGDVAGSTVLDLCAAPGGKTAQLADRGACVTALDRSAPRMTRLRENLARLDLAAETVVAKAEDWQPVGPFDAVLLDVPCSATGTIRRHPDLPHLKRADDLAKLSAAQARLLDRAADWLRPGGTLVYATCSLQSEEGPHQIARFLARRPDFAQAPAPALTPGLEDLIDDRGSLRSLPSHLSGIGGMDGFFAARLIREA